MKGPSERRRIRIDLKRIFNRYYGDDPEVLTGAFIGITADEARTLIRELETDLEETKKKADRWESSLQEIDHAFEVRHRVDIEGGGFGWTDPIHDIVKKALTPGDNHE